MSVVRYTPAKNTLSRRAGFEDFDKIFDNFFKNSLTNLSVPAPSVTDLKVDLDISETDKAYYVHADLPGIQQEGINLELTEGVLSISGEKQNSFEEDGKTYHRSERSYGSFMRSMQLPTDADESKIKANMKNGVLEIEIAKLKEAQPKKKKIHIGN